MSKILYNRAIRKYFLFVAAKARKLHDMESCKEADTGKNVEIPGESRLNTEFESISEWKFVVESIFNSKRKQIRCF